MQKTDPKELRAAKTLADEERLNRVAQELGLVLAMLSGEDISDGYMGRSKAEKIVKKRREDLGELMADRGFLPGVIVIPGCGDHPDIPHQIVDGQVKARGDMDLMMPAGEIEKFKVLELAQNATFVE